MSHDHNHDHTHHHEGVILEAAQQHMEMLTLSDRISRKALLKLLPNVGDRVEVELNPERSDEHLMSEDGSEFITRVAIVRIDGDTLDLVIL